MKTNPVGWFEIYVEDMERARRFYESVFDGQLERLETGDLECWAFPMKENEGGCAGALVSIPGEKPRGFSTLVYFSCSDCEAEEKRAVDAGGRVHRPKMSIGSYGFISLVYDTEGNLIGLHSMS